MTALPHLALPLRLSGAGGFEVLEQDSTDEVAQCVAVVIATPDGSRVEVPEFGSPRADFIGPRPDQIAAAVEEWEPRADVALSVLVAAGGIESVTELRVLVQPHV